MTRPVALLSVALAAAGCLALGVTPPQRPAEPWWFGGHFTPGYTRQELRDVRKASKPSENEGCVMGVSDPAAFGFGCASEANATLGSRLSSAGPCRTAGT